MSAPRNPPVAILELFWTFELYDSTWTVIMEIKFGFTMLAYYMWWVIVLLCLVTVLYKLITTNIII